jgi:prepilin-type processing-associated H-X9-DG protein
MNHYRPAVAQEEDRCFRAKYSMGRTALYVRSLSELADPGPSVRAVFMDWGTWMPMTTGLEGFRLGTWQLGRSVTNALFGRQPIHHGNGTCVSFADGHVEYWR